MTDILVKEQSKNNKWLNDSLAPCAVWVFGCFCVLVLQEERAVEREAQLAVEAAAESIATATAASAAGVAGTKKGSKKKKRGGKKKTDLDATVVAATPGARAVEESSSVGGAANGSSPPIVPQKTGREMRYMTVVGVISHSPELHFSRL